VRADLQKKYFKEDPRLVEWTEQMILHKFYHFCPDDGVQRAFMLASIPDEDDNE